MNLIPNSKLSSDSKVLFILGSPRVGSTFLYQLIINHFEVFYPSNHLNELFETEKFNPLELPSEIEQSLFVNYQSDYGKTQGRDQPSEASALFRYFFGGEHPSELNSKRPLSGCEKKLIQFFDHLYQSVANQKPLVFKNAWNCFRIKFLSEVFPNACFLWIRRDLADSAFSDLKARRKRGGPEVWNSATTKNYEEIQKLPYWEQVVEQQYFYWKRISNDLSQSLSERYYHVWYEDLCENQSDTITNLQNFLIPKGYNFKSIDTSLNIEISNKSNDRGNIEDRKRILRYCEEPRFFKLRYHRE